MESLSKPCAECGRIRALTEYHRDKRARDGRQRKCKKCVNGRVSIKTPCGTIEEDEQEDIMDECRCEDYLTCDHYEDCLELAAEANWRGWKALETVNDD